MFEERLPSAAVEPIVKYAGVASRERAVLLAKVCDTEDAAGKQQCVELLQQ